MKKAISLSLLTTTLLTAMVAGTNVHATEVGKTTREATATIEAGGGSHPPIVDPADPNDNTNQEGPLTLDYASHFEFGTIALSNEAINQSPVNTVTDNGSQVSPVFGAQVTDLRGTGDGWKLKVSLSEFKGSDNSAHTLQGATLVLPAGTPVTTGTVTDEVKPTTTAVTLQADDQAANLFTAEADQGMGSWFDNMAAKDIKLQAPSIQYADSYTATVTWSLQDTPA